MVVPHWQVMKMPQDMTFESAAALPTVLLTAQHAVNLAIASELEDSTGRISIILICLFLIANIVTTSKAPVTSSVALVPNGFLLLLVRHLLL